MVNSIKNNPALLEQLAKAYMANLVANQSTSTEKTEGSEKSYLSPENAKFDAFVSSNGTTNIQEVKDEVMELLLDMPEDQLKALMVEYGITEEAAEETTEEAPTAPETTNAPDDSKAPAADDAAKAADDAAKKAADDAAKAADDAAKAAADAAKAPAETTGAKDAAATSNVNASTLADGKDSSKIREEIEKLEEDKEKNYKEMEKIETEIEDLTKKAEENIMKAAAAQEEKVKEHEEQTQNAVNQEIQAYVNANKEGGEGMSKEDLQNNIKNSLADVPEIGDAVSAAVAANEQITEIEAKLGDLNKLIQDTNAIETEIEAKEKQYDATKEAEKAEAEKAKSCDPIGFTMGEGEDQVKYDFIVDDGEFDSTSDFLGAEDQWAEMAALDTDGNSIVTAAELEAGNIKAVKTDADGNQQVVSLAEEFGEDFSIDLNSYKEGGSHSAIDSTKDSDGDGVVDQNLLGTFSMNIKGETINGYNTLDDTEWLEENYGLSSESTEIKDDNKSNNYSLELKSHYNFFNTYTQKVQDLKEELKGAWTKLGLTEETLKELNNEAVDKATTQAEAGNTAASDEAKVATTPEKTETETKSEDEKLEKELELEENIFAGL